MSPLQFTFAHWPAALLICVPLLLNVSLFFYLFFYFRHNKMSRTFYFFLIPLCLWQFSDLMISLSATRETAFYWHYIIASFIHLIPALSLHFVLLFTENRRLSQSSFFMFFIYFVGFIFLFLSYGGAISFTAQSSEFWSWVIIEENNFPSRISAFWNVLLTLFTIILLVRFYKTSAKINEDLYLQSRLILIGFAFPAVSAIVAQFVFPVMLGMKPVPVSATSLSVFSLCVIIALRKHKLLSFSPRHAWANIIASMNEGLLIMNNNDEIQFANRCFCEMTGYSEKELLRKKAAAIFSPDFAKEHLEETISRWKKNIAGRYEIPVRKKSGEIIWCLISGSPYYDKQGKVIGSIGLHYDITERKKMELEREAIESNLRFFIEESLLCIYVVDPLTKKIILANKAFLELTGYTSEELERVSIYDIVDHTNEEIDEKIKEAVLVKKQNLGPRRWKRKNGEIVYLLASGLNINTNGRDLLYITAFDITDRKKAEADLKESELHLQRFVSESPFGICAVDVTSKKVIEANCSFLEMLGYEDTPLNMIDIHDFSNQTKESLNAIIQQVIETGKQNATERTWKKSNGEMIDVLVSALNLYKQGGHIIYFAVEDISELKKTQESLNKKIRDLNIFIYQVSHDIKGPLASILGLADIASRETRDPEQKKYLSMIEQSTRKLDNTLNALLEIILITKGKLKPEPIDLKREIEEIKSHLFSSPNFSKITFSEDIVIHKEFYSDKVMLQTILQNLIANAINYADLGKGRSFIHISAAVIDEFVRITIDDNGIGIAEELQSKIWNMFFRASQLSKGTGLGLFIVHSAIERLGGSITVESELRKGTEFIIAIPLEIKEDPEA